MRVPLALTLALMGGLAVAQMNTSLPAKQPSGSPPRLPNCRPQAQVLKDGTIEFTDCSGGKPKVLREVLPKLSSSDAPTGSSPEPAAAPVALDPQTNVKYQQSLQAGYDYQIYSYQQAKESFDWQYWSSKVIFWVVLGIVGAGLVFSALQFYLGFMVGHAQQETTNFEASLQGIKVSSSVLGVIVLTISIVFFYLYLKYVYPITNISQ